GFDLLGDSLANHQQNVYLIMVVSALIISGGLGFIVWRDLLEYHQKKKMTIHSKIALTVTSTLLLGGFVVFFFTERNGATLVEGN
ncbi:potassium transporter TrkG, partial [Enterococcus faecalis]